MTAHDGGVVRRSAILEALGDGPATTAGLADALDALPRDVERACDAMWRAGVLDRVVLPSGIAWRHATADRWVGAMPVPVELSHGVTAATDPRGAG